METEFRNIIAIGEPITVTKEFASKVANIAQAFLLTKSTWKEFNHVTPSMVCAMMVEIGDPCMCKYIEASLHFAVTEGMFNVIHGNRFTLA